MSVLAIGKLHAAEAKPALVFLPGVEPQRREQIKPKMAQAISAFVSDGVRTDDRVDLVVYVDADRPVSALPVRTATYTSCADALPPRAADA